MSYPTLPEGCICDVVGDDHYNTIVRHFECPIHDEAWRTEQHTRSVEHKRLFNIRSNAINRFERWAYRASEEAIEKFMKGLPDAP